MTNTTKTIMTIMTYTTMLLLVLGILGCQNSQAKDSQNNLSDPNELTRDKERYSDYDAALMPIHFMEEIYKIHVGMSEFVQDMKEK